MNGPNDWQRFFLKHAEEWRFTEGEARVLNALSAHANRDGLVKVTHLTEAEIGRQTSRRGIPRSARTVRRILAGLRAKGLVTSRQRGRKISAEYQLHDLLPVDQLTLEVDSTDRPELTARPTGRPVTSLTNQTGHLSDRQEREERFKEEVGDAHEPPTTDDVFPGTLDDVLTILATAKPGTLNIEPLAVSAALAAHPASEGYEHRKAALRIVEWSHQGGLRCSAANQLLWDVFVKQDQRRGRVSDRPRRPPRSTAPAGRPRKPWSGALARAMAAQGDQPETEGASA